MPSSDKLEEALTKLKQQGHVVGSAAVGTNGSMLIAIDGKLLTHAEIYAMAEATD